ncbi:MAG: tRNA lysidine(34) synthetase TilS [Pseudomonadota bacterium]
MKDAGFSELRKTVQELDAALDAPIGVAVSGGSDSLATLLLLHEASRSLHVATVNHGLRPEAAGEAAYVAEVCRGLNISHSTLSVDLSGASGNLQDQARRGRYKALREWAAQRRLGHVVLGHTMDDQAETFLMRLARGSGLDGLSGMAKRADRGGVAWHRPFLGTRRDELRDFLVKRGVRWIDDASNTDPRFERVRMRQALSALAPLGVTADRIAQTTTHLATARDALDAQARAAFEAYGAEEAGSIVLHCSDFGENPADREIFRRIVAAALRFVSGADYPPRADALRGLMDGLGKGEKRTLHGCMVFSGARLRIAREYNAVNGVRSDTKTLWDGRWQIRGPHEKGLEICALGEDVCQTPWRETGLPRESLRVTPAIWRGEALVAAPVAGVPNGWSAEATGRGKFADFLISR